MTTSAERIVARFTAATDWTDFNTTLMKLTKRLKRDAGAKTIRQNYRGTGSQKARRQLWIRFKNGAVIDLWLDMGFVSFGGVVTNHPEGGPPPSPKAVKYDKMTPEQVYTRHIKPILKAWVDGEPAAPEPAPEPEPEPAPEETDELTESNLVEYLKKHKSISVAELAYAFGGHPQKHTRWLGQLVQRGVLTKRGPKYFLAEPAATEPQFYVTYILDGTPKKDGPFNETDARQRFHKLMMEHSGTGRIEQLGFKPLDS